MRKTIFIAAVTATLLLCTATKKTAEAQTADPHVYHVVIWYMDSPEDGSRAERDSLLKIYFNKVTSKNEFVLHQSTATHFFTENSTEMVVISEYASLADIEKAFDRDTELEKAAWPDEKQRDTYFDRVDQNFTHHSDKIFSVMPDMTK